MTVESYRDCARFIAVTGNALPEATAELADNDALLDQVVAELHAAKAKQAKGKGSKQRGKGKKRDLDDLIKNAVRAGILAAIARAPFGSSSTGCSSRVRARMRSSRS